jgi:ribonuclease J
MNNEGLIFIPLGGSNEIGMNFNLYGCNGKWLIVDVGVSFYSHFGVEVLLPDPSFIEERKNDIVGMVITHAHEDHVGGVAHLWNRLRCPVYLTPFTAAILRSKLKDANLENVPINIIDLNSSFSLDPFHVEFIALTHSIPEPNALLITTPFGKIFHTGDWKIDADPLIGEPINWEKLNKIGDEGVLAMVCDSTNIFNEGESGSEAFVREGLIDIINQQKGRVIVACFASNVARVQTSIMAGFESGRTPALAGRSMYKMISAAKEVGYLKDLPHLAKEEDLYTIPRDKVLIACTGSQGEARAALSRIAAKKHQFISLEEGDTVIFSSRVIPGNEREIHKLHNTLVKQGIKVITHDDAIVHVSGHPSRDEVKMLYKTIRPTLAIPVHGECRHLVEHADFAVKHCGVKYGIPPVNGSVILIAPGKPELIGSVHSGYLAIDGKHIVNMEGKMLMERRFLSTAGVVFVSLVMTKNKRYKECYVSFAGVTDERHRILKDKIIGAIKDLFDDDKTPAYENISQITKHVVMTERRTKPYISLHMIED